MCSRSVDIVIIYQLFQMWNYDHKFKFTCYYQNCLILIYYLINIMRVNNKHWKWEEVFRIYLDKTKKIRHKITMWFHKNIQDVLFISRLQYHCEEITLHPESQNHEEYSQIDILFGVNFHNPWKSDTNLNEFDSIIVIHCASY